MKKRYLQGEKIFLSPATEDDVTIITEIKNDPFIRPFMSAGLPKTEEDTLEQIKKMRKDGSPYFMILDNVTEEILGYVILENLSSVIRASEMHIAIKEKYTSKGIGKEVIKIVTEYAFNELNFHSVRALIRANNPRSLKCFLSQGYQKVGCLPEWSFYDGQYNDCYIVDCIPRFLKS